MTLPIGTYTLYNNFENCPFKAWHMYVLKDIPRVETPEMKWGNDVHKAMEHRLGRGDTLPETMFAAEPICATIDALPFDYPQRVEYQLGMKENGEPSDYFGPHVWFRGKSDWHVRSPSATGTKLGYTHAWLLDWKTGKPREEPFELETNALLLKVNHPELEHIVGEYFWMQTGQFGFRYTLTDWGKTFARLQALRAEMQTYDTSGVWPKRKNPLCGWCPVLSCENNTSHRRR